MQTISQITANLTQQPPQGIPQNSPMTLPTSDTAQPSQQLVMEIGLMFAQWKSWFKNKMRTRDEGEADWGAEMVLVWAKYLTKKSITQREFNLAKDLVIDELDFPPNNAKEFLELARQTSEYPDMRQAYLSATEQKYSHGVAYETAKRVGFWELKSQVEPVTWKTWQEVYPKVCDEHRSGADFTLPESQQVTYERTVADSKTADDYLAQMFAVVGKQAVA